MKLLKGLLLSGLMLFTGCEPAIEPTIGDASNEEKIEINVNQDDITYTKVNYSDDMETKIIRNSNDAKIFIKTYSPSGGLFPRVYRVENDSNKVNVYMVRKFEDGEMGSMNVVGYEITIKTSLEIVKDTTSVNIIGIKESQAVNKAS